MSNYKNMRFSNTTEDFKSWSRNFLPMDKDAVQATGYKKHENYYLELQLVKGFITGDAFVGHSIREYNPIEADFNTIPNEKEEELLKTVFKSKVDQFKAKYL